MTDQLPAGLPVPAYTRDNPVMAAAFAGCVRWAWSERGVRQRFEEESGHAPLLPGASPLDHLIDDATGRTGRYVHDFVVWVTRELWGEEERSTPEDHARAAEAFIKGDGR